MQMCHLFHPRAGSMADEAERQKSYEKPQSSAPGWVWCWNAYGVASRDKYKSTGHIMNVDVGVDYSRLVAS